MRLEQIIAYTMSAIAVIAMIVVPVYHMGRVSVASGEVSCKKVGYYWECNKNVKD